MVISLHHLMGGETREGKVENKSISVTQRVSYFKITYLTNGIFSRESGLAFDGKPTPMLVLGMTNAGHCHEHFQHSNLSMKLL